MNSIVEYKIKSRYDIMDGWIDGHIRYLDKDQCDTKKVDTPPHAFHVEILNANETLQLFTEPFVTILFLIGIHL